VFIAAFRELGCLSFHLAEVSLRPLLRHSAVEDICEGGDRGGALDKQVSLRALFSANAP
jgi:hypothetical protein